MMIPNMVTSITSASTSIGLPLPCTLTSEKSKGKESFRQIGKLIVLARFLKHFGSELTQEVMSKFPEVCVKITVI